MDKEIKGEEKEKHKENTWKALNDVCARGSAGSCNWTYSWWLGHHRKKYKRNLKWN